MELQKSVLLAAIAATCVVAAPARAHDHDPHAHHAEELKSARPQLSGGSLYQLESKWTKANGEKIDLTALAGKPLLVAMLYTRCKSACPMLIQDMKNLQAKIPKSSRERVGMAVFSLDPEGDTPEALTKFAEKTRLQEKDWTLLTAQNPGDVAELAAALGVQYKKIPGNDFIHSNVIFLLNEKGEIVARKEGLRTTSEEFVDRITAAAKKPKK